jgi:bifunctional non-homologous end joining protein LigD
MSEDRRLPDFIPPMLSMPGEPFDSQAHLFEIKWDGTRAMAFIENGAVRLMNRRKFDIGHRYPDLQILAAAPPGTVLDGEIVVFKDGKSDFQLLARRDQARAEFRIRQAAKALPATFVVFDQIYEDFQPIINLTCAQRRERARNTVKMIANPQVIMSEGVVGDGIDYFQKCIDAGLEGVMAKRLDSLYLPDKRTDCWIKIKRQETSPCVVVGYLINDQNQLRSLVIAAEKDGILTHVGQVGSGLTGELCDTLLARLRTIARKEPVVSCSVKGHWVEPQLYCLVRFMERTRDGHFRAPVLVKML